MYHFYFTCIFVYLFIFHFCLFIISVWLTIVCSRSVGRGLRAEVYVMMECSYLRIYFAVDGMPIEMYGENWIPGLLTSDDIMLYNYYGWIRNDARNLTVLPAHSWHELYGSY